MDDTLRAFSLELQFQPLSEHVVLPSYAKADDAGMDLALPMDFEERKLWNGTYEVFKLGFKCAIPKGWEGQIRPRSGLAAKHGVTVLNSPGTIDAGFRGEWGVILINHGNYPLDMKPGMRIAQLVLAPVCKIPIKVVTELSETERGSGGFGSTGS